MDEDLEHVSHCASVVGSFIGKSLIRLLAGLGNGGNSVPCNSTLSFKNALKFLDIGDSTLRGYLRDGKIKAVRLDNGRIRFEKGELVRFQSTRLQEKQ